MVVRGGRRGRGRVVVDVEVDVVEVDVDVDVDVEVDVVEVEVEVAAAVVVEPATVVEVTEVGSGPVVTDTDGTVDVDAGPTVVLGPPASVVDVICGLGGQRVVGLFVVAAGEDHQGDDAEDHGDGAGGEGDERARVGSTSRLAAARTPARTRNPGRLPGRRSRRRPPVEAAG